jgi:penicillin amidase
MNIYKSLFRLLFGKRLPITRGTLEIHGIHQDVVIRRDEYGIPYIEAQEDHDAWYALGFCQGQDRAFQIEGLKRVVRGTLSELVGSAGLPVDKLSRRIGFFRTAQEQWEVLDEEIRQMLESYAQGVTDGAAIGSSRPAHEYALLRGHPTPYQGVDVIGLIKLMSFNIASNWDVELARLKILASDGAEALRALDPRYPDYQPATTPPLTPVGQTIDHLSEDLNIFKKAVGGHGGGSNNWVIAPDHTVTGRPVLANDPHLAPVVPAPVYLAHIRTPEWNLSGAMFIGTPVFAAGHNGVAAWGITAGMVDNVDLFVEEIGPDGMSVLEGKHYVPCEIRKELIRVRGGTTVEEEVLITPRGPIVGQSLEEGCKNALSLRAVWLDPRPIEGLLKMHRVKSFSEFRRTFQRWPMMSLNLVYADTTGDIGWQLAGEAPKRKKGYGMIPLPGSDQEVGWEKEMVPFEEMPYVVNPEVGLIATANNRPFPEKKGPFLGEDWVDGYRVSRILEGLMGSNKWDLNSTGELQMTQDSLPWREVRDIIIALPEMKETKQVLDLLREWDGKVLAESPAATVYELFMNEMIQRSTAAKAPPTFEWALGKSRCPLITFNLFAVRRFSHMVKLFLDQPEGWFERSWEEEMTDALAAVARRLRDTYGKNPNKWAWGKIRPLTICNAFGEKPPLHKIFNLGPFPWGGDATTVSQAATNLLSPTKNPLFISCLRIIIDVGNWEENRFVLPAGQSGNPLSPHYDDLLPLWQRGEGVTIAWSPEKIGEIAKEVLELKSNIE